MGLFDEIQGFFNPEIINRFNYLYDNYYDGLKLYCTGFNHIRLSRDMPYQDKKWLVENEDTTRVNGGNCNLCSYYWYYNSRLGNF